MKISSSCLLQIFDECNDFFIFQNSYNFRIVLYHFLDYFLLCFLNSLCQKYMFIFLSIGWLLLLYWLYFRLFLWFWLFMFVLLFITYFLKMPPHSFSKLLKQHHEFNIILISLHNFLWVVLHHLDSLHIFFIWKKFHQLLIFDNLYW